MAARPDRCNTGTSTGAKHLKPGTGQAEQNRTMGKINFCTVAALEKGKGGMPTKVVKCHPFGVAPEGFVAPPTWKQAGMWDREFSPDRPIVLLGRPEEFEGKDLNDIPDWKKAGITCQVISLLPETPPLLGRWKKSWGEKWGDKLAGTRPEHFHSPVTLDADFLPPPIGGEFHHFLVTREVFEAHPERKDLVTIGGLIDTPQFLGAIEWLQGREDREINVPTLKGEFQKWDLPIVIMAE